MTDWVIVDTHTAATDTPDVGGPLAPDTLARIVAALEVQANRDFGAFWGGGPVRWRVATPSALPLPAERIATLVDVMPEADAGAAAFHDWSGVPEIVVAKSACNSLLSGADALSVLFSHESCEANGDAPCNRWSDNPADGYSYALETCDAIEASTYATADGVSLANFLLPAFFDPGGVAPFDFGATVAAPAGVTAAFSTAPGGYQVRRPTGGGEAQIWGTIRAHHLARKRHPSSRTFRRGARP